MSLSFELPVPMQHYQRANRKRVIVIGCGGTGGYVVPGLARLIANLTDQNIDLVLIDGDEVESKNLVRQNFITPDLGRPKAEVLAERYSAAFGLTIQFIPSYMKSAQMLEDLDLGEAPGSMLVLGCVDNHRTRREIARWYRAKHGRVWIDAGNEEMSGQVICGVHQNPYHKGREGKSFGLPSVADLFPEIENDEAAVFNDELSCAERAISAPQNIATNMLAANFLLTFTQQVLLGSPLHTHGVFFSSERSSTDAMLNTKNRLDYKSWPGYKAPPWIARLERRRQIRELAQQQKEKRRLASLEQETTELTPRQQRQRRIQQLVQQQNERRTNRRRAHLSQQIRTQAFTPTEERLARQERIRELAAQQRARHATRAA